MREDVVILGIARTPLGGMQGMLSDLTAPQLGAWAIKGAIVDAGVTPSDVKEVLMGCVLPAGTGQAPARQAALGAGLPQTTLATTLNKVCGSGMRTVMMAHDTLQSQPNALIVAGGMESMTNAPYLLSKARGGYRLGHGELLDHMFTDGLQDAYQGGLMGVYAEATAEKYSFTREAQDAFAIASLNRANAAIASGAFKREIVPVVLQTRKGEVVVDTDEQPATGRPDKIPSLKPAFKKDGTVTAANASSISDGAAALVVTSAQYAAAKGLKPLARIVAQSQYAQAPEWFTTAPVGAMKAVLEAANWSVADVDLFEINEAFAVVTMAGMEELAIPHEKVNVNGGACALGHPLGASGARVLVTLIAALQAKGLKRGVASLCIGGGEAVAMAVEIL